MDFKQSTESFVAKKTGFNVNLVEKTHKFLLELVISDPDSIERIGLPDAKSPLYEEGNCILRALYLLGNDRDICGTYEEVARSRGINGSPVRPYTDCISYIGECSLSLVAESDLKIGGGYIIHADGKADEPHCLPLYINRGGKDEVTSSPVKYIRNLPEMREMIAIAIDKPILFEYSSVDTESGNSSQRAKNIDDMLLRTLLAG